MIRRVFHAIWLGAREALLRAFDRRVVATNRAWPTPNPNADANTACDSGVESARATRPSHGRCGR